MKFIQFIGTQRSGSNLLRTMLNQLPEITAPHPPHILKTFEPLLPVYGNLQNDDNFSILVNDVCTWVELNPVPWNINGLDRNKVQNRCKTNSLIELFYVIYAYYAELDDSDYTCCKSMNNVYQYEDLEKSGISPYYVYLHRDGRDVACSFKKAIVGEKHVYHIAKQWKADQEKALEVKQNIPSNRFIEVNYRHLITDPKLELEKICSFLNVPYRNNMLDFFHAEESINTAKSGEMWKNLSHPIMAGNYNKYLKELTSEEIKIFECVTGDMLERLDYSVSTDYKMMPKFRQMEINNFDLQNNTLKNKAISKANKHDIELRSPQKEFLGELKNKFQAEYKTLNKFAV